MVAGSAPYGHGDNDNMTSSICEVCAKWGGLYTSCQRHGKDVAVATIVKKDSSSTGEDCYDDYEETDRDTFTDAMSRSSTSSSSVSIKIPDLEQESATPDFLEDDRDRLMGFLEWRGFITQQHRGVSPCDTDGGSVTGDLSFRSYFDNHRADPDLGSPRSLPESSSSSSSPLDNGSGSDDHSNNLGARVPPQQKENRKDQSPPLEEEPSLSPSSSSSLEPEPEPEPETKHRIDNLSPLRRHPVICIPASTPPSLVHGNSPLRQVELARYDNMLSAHDGGSSSSSSSEETLHPGDGGCDVSFFNDDDNGTSEEGESKERGVSWYDDNDTSDDEEEDDDDSSISWRCSISEYSEAGVVVETARVVGLGGPRKWPVRIVDVGDARK